MDTNYLEFCNYLIKLFVMSIFQSPRVFCAKNAEERLILHGYFSNTSRETMGSRFILIIHPVQLLQNRPVSRSHRAKRRRLIIEIPHILLEILTVSGIAKMTQESATAHCTSCRMKFIGHHRPQAQVAWRVDMFPIDNRRKILF